MRARLSTKICRMGEKYEAVYHQRAQPGYAGHPGTENLREGKLCRPGELSAPERKGAGAGNRDIPIQPRGRAHGCEVDCFQSNHEGALIDEVHRAYFEKADGIIINAGGYTHTSVALMDALLAVSLPVIEVHLSDPSRREEFRHRSYVAMAAKGSVVGLGFTGYRRAMELLMALAE